MPNIYARRRAFKASSLLGCLALLAAAIWVDTPARAADAAFTQFIASLWPEAEAAGVSRETFDRETRGLEPDYKLPDLILPGRPATGAPSQAEFVQVPAGYVNEGNIARLAGDDSVAPARNSPVAAAGSAGPPACSAPSHDSWLGG